MNQRQLISALIVGALIATAGCIGSGTNATETDTDWTSVTPMDLTPTEAGTATPTAAPATTTTDTPTPTSTATASPTATPSPTPERYLYNETVTSDEQFVVQAEDGETIRVSMADNQGPVTVVVRNDDSGEVLREITLREDLDGETLPVEAEGDGYYAIELSGMDQVHVWIEVEG